MMAADPILIDTSILVTASAPARHGHEVTLRWLISTRGLLIPAQVMREYLVVATRPEAVNGLGRTPEQARRNLVVFLGWGQPLAEDRAILPAFNALLDRHRVVGKRFHDAWLAATAITHGIHRLATFNPADFTSFADQMQLIDPTLS
jgi:predicted nucleic acid-binding protein